MTDKGGENSGYGAVSRQDAQRQGENYGQEEDHRAQQTAQVWPTFRRLRDSQLWTFDRAIHLDRAARP
jgi:hypothetical protein